MRRNTKLVVDRSYAWGAYAQILSKAIGGFVHFADLLILLLKNSSKGSRKIATKPNFGFGQESMGRPGGISVLVLIIPKEKAWAGTRTKQNNIMSLQL